MACPICRAGEETLAHFDTECEALDGVRRRFGVGRGDRLEEVLLFGGRMGEVVERTMKMLEEMYGARRKKIEEQVDRSAYQQCRRSEGVPIGRQDPALYLI